MKLPQEYAEYKSRITGRETVCILQAVSLCDMMLCNRQAAFCRLHTVRKNERMSLKDHEQKNK